MKTMTCREMGGSCDQKVMAKTAEEMMEKGMKHMKQAHPEVAKKMEEMSEEDFEKKWDMAPEMK